MIDLFRLHSVFNLGSWFCPYFYFWTVCLRVSVGGSGFWSGRGGAVHDATVSNVGADPPWSSSEKQHLLLERSQTAATTLLHRWSETSSLSNSPTLAQSLFVFLCFWLCCLTDVVSWLEVERLFHQSVFESMPLTRLDQKGVLVNAAGPLGTLEPAQQQTPTIIPWDNPLSYAKQQLNNLQTKGLLPCWLIQLLWSCDTGLHTLQSKLLFILTIGQTFLTEDAGNTEVLFICYYGSYYD